MVSKIIISLLVGFSFISSAYAAPEALVLKEKNSVLVCQIFKEDGYFCEEVKDPNEVRATNTLILDYQTLVSLGAKPLVPVVQYAVAKK